MIRLRAVIWTAIMVGIVIAAPAAQSDLPRLLDRAEALLSQLNLAEAEPQFERALAAARESASDPIAIRALLGLGEVARHQRRIVDGRARGTEALAIAERLEDHRHVGEAHLLLARLERAARNEAGADASARRAMATYEKIDDRRGMAAAGYELANATGLDADGRGRLLEKAAADARAGGDRNLEGVALHSFGDELFNAARFEESLELLTRAAAAFEASQSPVDLGTVYNSIGRVYRAHGRLDEALRYQKAALELHRQGNDRFMLLQSLNAVSTVYQRRHELSTARTYLQEAIDVAASVPASPSALRAQDFLRANMASVLADLGEPAAAAVVLEQVIADGRDSFPGIRYRQLSLTYTDLGRGPEALAAAERAIALCGSEQLNCIEALFARSDARAVTGDREGALADLTLALGRIEELRAQLVPADFFKQNFSSQYQEAYGAMIARQLDAGLNRESLETAELARSRAFLDLLASRAIAPSSRTPGFTMPLTLRGGNASSSVASPVTTAPANASDLVRTAARLRSSLLLYWVDESETFIWVVRPDGEIGVRRVKVARSRLDTLIRETAPFADTSGTRGVTAPSALRESSAAWRTLYSLLIEPVRTLLPARNGSLLTIVPHDVLANLSFAALQSSGGRYLLEDYTLHYATAGALFQFTSGTQRANARAGAMLMLSNPDATRRSKLDPVLPRLPGAHAEATAIVRQIAAGKVLSLTGVTATESAVREQASTRSILHFAAHAIIRDDDPFASYLALSRSSASEDGDGVLTAQDVYHLKLSADLVVLSACRSASGTVAGDGVAAFARAFVYAGASSLIASVWEVADEPSNRLLPAFYRSWLGGATKAASLRQAQLRLLADLRAGQVRANTPIGPVPIPEHPVFWAGFVLFGEPD